MRSFVRSVLAIAPWMLGAVLSLAPLPVAADEEAVEIRILVRAVDRVPAGVRVTLLAPEGVTVTVPLANDWSARIRDVLPGIYRARVTIGADTFVSAEFDAVRGRVATVTVDARPASMRVIGTVRAEPSVTVVFDRLDTRDAVRALSGSLAEALGQLAGATVSGSDGSFSLRNFDASQIGASVNGVGFGGSASSALAAFGHLFSGGSASFTPTDNALGGSLNYTTLQPTKNALGYAAAEIGDRGRSFLSASASGSFRRLGWAVQYVDRTSATQLQNRTYADLSGATYAHDFSRHSTGELVKLRQSVGDATTLEAATLLSNIDYGTACALFVSELPCGNGPAARADSRFDYASVTARTSLHATEINLSAAINASHNFTDESARTFLNTPKPLVLQQHFVSRGGGLTVTHPFGLHTPLVTVALGDHRDLYARSETTAPAIALVSTLSTFSVSANDTYKPNARLSLTLAESFNRSTYISSGVTSDLSASYRFDARRSLSASARVGTTEASYSAAGVLPDPTFATYDCQDGLISVLGPTDAPGRQSARSLSASYRQSIGLGRISLNAYQTQSDGAQLQLYVPITATADGAYLAALGEVWNKPGVCGGYAFANARAYASETIGGLRQRYSGVTASATIPLGRALVAIANLSRSDAVLASLDPRLAGPTSFYRTGEQLPLRGRISGSLTLDAAFARGAEFLVNARYDERTARSLPATTVLALGARVKAGRGAFTGFVANLLNLDAFGFTAPRGYAPLALTGGGSVGFAATPLAPRQFQLRYAIDGLSLGSPAPPRMGPESNVAVP